MPRNSSLPAIHRHATGGRALCGARPPAWRLVSVTTGLTTYGRRPTCRTCNRAHAAHGGSR